MSQELITAITNNNIPEAKRLIDSLTVDQLNTKGAWDTMPLFVALQHNRTDVVSALLAKGVDINGMDITPSYTPLSLAIQFGAEDSIKLLLSSKPNLELAPNSNYTPIMSALSQGKTSIAKMLVDAGASVTAALSNNQTALHIAVNSETTSEFVRDVLLPKGAKAHINTKDSNGQIPFHNVRKVDMAKCLINAGSEIKVLDNHNISPILRAVTTNRPEMVEFLLSVGLKDYIDTPNSSNGYNPLWSAADSKNINLIKILIKNGANLNYQNPKQENKTPLMAAVAQLQPQDDHSIVKEFIKAGVDLSLKNGQGKTALEMATEKGLTNASKWLGVGELANKVVTGTNVDKLEDNLQDPEIKELFIERIVNSFVKSGANQPVSLDKYISILPGDLIREVHKNLGNVKYANNTGLDSGFLSEITEKVAEGNDRIGSNNGEATVILGPTGSGKTTLGHILSGMKLQAMRNDLNFRLVIDAVSPESPFHISHSKKSETTVPNRFISDDKVKIWDCPGFNDTTPAQELANSFYIAKLFTEYSKIKLVFVVNEGDIVNNRGIGFVNLVQQFCSGFGDISMIGAGIVFVVSAATPGKQAKHVQYEIDEIISQNTALDPDVKDMMQYLSDSVKIFPQPTAEGVLNCDELRKSIESTGAFVQNESMGRFNLSPKAQDYGIEVLKRSFHALEQIVDIVMEACQNPSAACKYGKDNIFTKNYEMVKKWLPSHITYTPSVKIRDHGISETYADVKHLMKLNAMLKQINKLPADTSPNRLEAVVEIVEKALNVFEEFVMMKDESGSDNSAESDLKTQIRHFAYVAVQMKEFCYKFTSVIDASKLPAFLKLSVLSDRLAGDVKKSDTDIAATFKKSVIGLDIVQESTDISYFKEAIKLLNKEPTNSEVMKKKAVAFKCIGSIKKQEGKNEEALKYLSKAVEFDKELAPAYEEIGDILDNEGRIAEAAKFYKALGNTFKMKQCYKKLIIKDPNNSKLHEEYGDTLASFGDISTAVKYYNSANGFIRDIQQKKVIAGKIVKTMSAEFKAGIEKLYQDRAAGTTKFYQFEQINVKDSFPTIEEALLIGAVDLGIGGEY